MTYPRVETFWEQSGLAVMARLEGWAGELVTQASLSAIAYKVMDVDRNKEVTGSGTCTIATTVYDEEQFNAAWPWSDTGDGFNLSFVIPAAAFPRGGHQYRVEFTFTPASGEVFHLAVDQNMADLYGK